MYAKCRPPAFGSFSTFSPAWTMSSRLGVGEPDFVTPEHILQAGVDSLAKGETHYTSNYGLMELREAVAEYLSGQYGVQYDPKTEILLTAGVSEAVDIALRAVIDPGDEVIVPEPAYVSYRPCITFAGGEPVGINSSAETNFRITAAQIAAAITPRTKALLLGFPANPTGAMLPREEWLQIVELARQHNLIMLSDEIYGRLAYTMEHTCVSALPGAWDRTILLGGFSKSYAMTGWRIGYVAAPSAVLEYIMKVHQYVVMCAPTMSQYAALQAVRHGEPDVERMLSEYTKRRTLIVDGLNDIGLDCVPPGRRILLLPKHTFDRSVVAGIRGALAARRARRLRGGRRLRPVRRRPRAHVLRRTDRRH